MSIVDSTAGSHIHLTIPQEIFAEEEEDAFIYHIREEIVQSAMKEIHEIYLKRQLYNLVVDCANEACSKLISFEFYHHNPLPDLTRGWLYYTPEKTSSPDSWACGNLHTSTAPVVLEQIQTVEPPEIIEAVCTCDPAMSCNCQKKDKEIKNYVEALNYDYSEASSVHSVEMSTLFDASAGQTQVMVPEECEVEEEGSTRSVSVDAGIDKLLKAVDSRSVLFPKLAMAKTPQVLEEQKALKVEPLPPIRVEIEFDDEAKKSSTASCKKKKKFAK